MNDVTCVCLAAGRSSRMKGDHKLLKELGGRTVIERVAAEITQLSFADIVFVTGEETEAIRALLLGYPLRIVKNEQSALGMHSSIRTAIQTIMPDSKAMLVCLADQPFELKERLERMMSEKNGLVIDENSLLRSTVDSNPGHPVLIGRNYFARILEQPDGDYGCSYLFKENPFQAIPQPESALWDLDTAEDFERLSPHAPA